jgi:flagellar assembly protein FliH
MATVIKASAARVDRPDAFQFAELDAGAGGEKPMDRAGIQALIDAQERLEQARRAVVPAARAAVDGILAAKTEWLAHWERTALSLATAIAERILRRQLERTPDVTLDLVKEALELAAGSADLQLRMHPDDLALLGAQVEQIIAELGRLGAAEVVPDPAIARGGCRVDTRYGTIDQRLETQLARIAQELL